MWHLLVIHPSLLSASLLLQLGLESETFPHFLAWEQELPKTPALLVQLAAEVDGLETHSWVDSAGSSLGGPVRCVTQQPFLEVPESLPAAFPQLFKLPVINDPLLFLQTFLLVLLGMAITQHMSHATQNTHMGLSSIQRDKLINHTCVDVTVMLS